MTRRRRSLDGQRSRPWAYRRPGLAIRWLLSLVTGGDGGCGGRSGSRKGVQLNARLVSLLTLALDRYRRGQEGRAFLRTPLR